MQVFVTSNQQFGRPSAISKFKRPYSTVEEMNDNLVQEWNSTVTENDIVYVLGNFAWDPDTAEKISQRLNGVIYLLEGEIDLASKEIIQRGIMNGKLMMSNSDINVYEEAEFCLSYWPLLNWPKKTKGYYSLVGHPSKEYKTDHKKKIINVCCDRWAYKPVAINRLKSFFDEISEQ